MGDVKLFVQNVSLNSVHHEELNLTTPPTLHRFFVLFLMLTTFPYAGMVSLYGMLLIDFVHCPCAAWLCLPATQRLNDPNIIGSGAAYC
jgi:hypothetical protein